MIIIVEDKIVHREIAFEHFACDLSACKGACCWEGDHGAPLEESELPILDRIKSSVLPYLTEGGRTAIEEQGAYVKTQHGKAYSTPLINNQPCAYYHRDESGLISCAIEMAWRDGKIDFQKPISCHLYPIRITKGANGFDYLAYDQWSICHSACAKGKGAGIKLYQFLKTPLIRKYGSNFYEALEAVCELLEKDKK